MLVLTQCCYLCLLHKNICICICIYIYTRDCFIFLIVIYSHTHAHTRVYYVRAFTYIIYKYTQVQCQRCRAYCINSEKKKQLLQTLGCYLYLFRADHMFICVKCIRTCLYPQYCRYSTKIPDSIKWKY